MPNFLTAARDTLYANVKRGARRASAQLATLFQGFGGQGFGRLRILKPGTQYDWEQQAGSLEKNSAVAACLRWILNNAGEPELVARRKFGKGHRDPLANFPFINLALTPNPAMDKWDFWGWIALSCVIDGNGYAWKRRSAAGRVIELWPLHHQFMAPVYPPDGTEWLTGWVYRINGIPHALDVSDVIHFKWGIPDRNNDRLHMSPLKSAVCEIVTDNEAIVWGAGLLKNAGIPALAIIPQTAGDFLTLDQAREMKLAYRENFTADNIGDVFVPTGPVKLEKVGYSPSEMAVEILQRIPESRICATIGLPMQVAGLLSGEATGSGVFGTAREQARAAAYQDCLIPLQKRMASALTRELLPDFVDDSSRIEISWDYGRVECLAENEGAKVDRAGKMLMAGGIMRSEYREELGLEVTDDDKVYYLPRGITVVDEKNTVVESASMKPAAAGAAGMATAPTNGQHPADGSNGQPNAPPAEGKKGLPFGRLADRMRQTI